MSRKFTLWFIAAVLVAYGAYTLWLVRVYSSVWFLLWSVPCFVGAVGLVLAKPWARFLVYVIAFFTAAGWAAFTVMLAVHGWPYSGFVRTVTVLLPGLLLVALCVGASIFVRSHFGAASAQQI